MPGACNFHKPSLETWFFITNRIPQCGTYASVDGYKYRLSTHSTHTLVGSMPLNELILTPFCHIGARLLLCVLLAADRPTSTNSLSCRFVSLSTKIWGATVWTRLPHPQNARKSARNERVTPSQRRRQSRRRVGVFDLFGFIAHDA